MKRTTAGIKKICYDNLTCEQQNNFAIVVNTCDDYCDVWELFIRSMEEFFPKCGAPIYFNTESINVLPFKTSLNVRFVNNIGPWGERIKSCLQQIKEEFVLNLFDDYLLDDFIDIEKLKNAKELLSSNECLSAVYLNAISLNYHLDLPNAGFREIRNFTEYRVNSAPAIWRKNDLISLTHNDDTPWSWEIFGTYRSFNSKRCFLSPSSVQNNIITYDYQNGGAIYRGKWVRSEVDEKIRKYHIKLDLAKRGIASSQDREKRSLYWKLNFLFTGFKTDGFKSLWYVYFYLRNKVGLH